MNTGVIRKIDDLGRIVIPKEIRKNLNIRSGEDIQIFIEEDKIVLKKYQKMLSIKENAQKYIDAFTKLTQSKIYVTDKEKIVSSSIKNDINIGLDNKIIELMRERKGDEGFNISERAVDVQIVNLRRKLGQRGQDVETIRGSGYKLKEIA